MTPDLYHIATTIIRAVEGTSGDIEVWTQDNPGPWDDLSVADRMSMLRYIDTKIWRCADCEYFVPTNDLNEDELCFSCRPASA